jgi:glycosyltransferase involved in cell wall biosynthesis
LKRIQYKVCHLAKYYPPAPGGIETHVQTLARAQADMGLTVKVICVNESSSQGRVAIKTKTVREQDGKVQVIRLGRLFTLARFDCLHPKFLPNIWAIFEEAYDVVHLHTPNPTMLVAWLIVGMFAGFMGRPKISLVITHHSDIIKQRILKYALRPIEYLAYKQAECILTDSNHYVGGSKFLRAFNHKVKVLPLGIDCSAYSQPSDAAQSYAQTLKERYGANVWLAVGRLVYYKALDVAIKALAFVPGTLIIIGTGPLERELRTLTENLGLAERVIWHGHANADELAGAYQAATALWFPSNVRSEGFGMVQVEAMASGCPVINANIPCSGVPWVSRHEQEGLTVPINNPIALAQAAQRMLNEPGLRERLAIASRERVYKEFDHKTMAQRSLAIYEQLVVNAETATYLKTLPLK